MRKNEWKGGDVVNVKTYPLEMRSQKVIDDLATDTSVGRCGI